MVSVSADSKTIKCNFTLWKESHKFRSVRCTRWLKYYRDYLCVNKSQFVPVIFEPPCIVQSQGQKSNPEGPKYEGLADLTTTFDTKTRKLECGIGANNSVRYKHWTLISLDKMCGQQRHGREWEMEECFSCLKKWNNRNNNRSRESRSFSHYSLPKNKLIKTHETITFCESIWITKCSTICILQVYQMSRLSLSLSCECCVFPGDGPIPRPEQSYRLWCVTVSYL